MHHFKAYTPFWRVVNRVLSFFCAAVILISGLTLLAQAFSSDGLVFDGVDMPMASEYDEPNMRIGLVYGSSVKSSYTFTSLGELTFGYNLHSKGEQVAVGKAPAGNYTVKNASGYTVILSVFDDPELNTSSFDAIYEKAVEILSVYKQTIFPMLTENGFYVCIGTYDTQEEAESQAQYMYTDLGMDNIFGGDDDIGEGEDDLVDGEGGVEGDDDLTDGTEIATVEAEIAPQNEDTLYLEFAAYGFSSANSLVLCDANATIKYAASVGYSYENKMAVWTDFENGNYIVKDQNQYESAFEFSRYKSGSTNGVTVITIVKLEKYVMGVLSDELYTSWHNEVQKAFAIITRSYSISNRDKHYTYGFDICNNSHCQVYKGCRKVNDNIRTAVNDTCGVVLTDKGKVAAVNYSSVGGGSTVNCEEAWQSPRTYLKAVPTPWEKYRDYGNLTSGGYWHVEITGQQMYEMLASKSLQGSLDSAVVDAKIDSFCTNSSYVYQLTLTDANGHTLTITKSDTIRNTLGLKSANFVIGKAGQTVKAPVYELDCFPSVYNENRTIGTYYKASGVTFASVWSGGSKLISGIQSVVYPDGVRDHDLDNAETEIVMPNGTYRVNKNGLPDILNSKVVMYYDSIRLQSTSGATDIFVIEGKGSGHGVGICQYGAWDLARLGYDHLTILRYYFKNVTFGLAVDYI